MCYTVIVYSKSLQKMHTGNHIFIIENTKKNEIYIYLYLFLNLKIFLNIQSELIDETHDVNL